MPYHINKLDAHLRAFINSTKDLNFDTLDGDAHRFLIACRRLDDAIQNIICKRKKDLDDFSKQVRFIRAYRTAMKHAWDGTTDESYITLLYTVDEIDYV